jgi:hypothetical protein
LGSLFEKHGIPVRDFQTEKREVAQSQRDKFSGTVFSAGGHRDEY